MKEIIKRGAEAILYLEDGMLVKERIKKSYRIESIDKKLREERTRKEVKIISDCRRIGINVPKVFSVDEKNFKIIMEFIDGKVLKEILNSLDKNEVEKICFNIGKDVGKMHSYNIIHGDLTTSNMIFKDCKIYFIDFGLASYSNRIEDRAVDLHLFYEALKSVHYEVLDICWKSFLNGYRSEYKEAEKVLNRLEELEKRGRYIKK